MTKKASKASIVQMSVACSPSLDMNVYIVHIEGYAPLRPQKKKIRVQSTFFFEGKTSIMTGMWSVHPKGKDFFIGGHNAQRFIQLLDKSQSASIRVETPEYPPLRFITVTAEDAMVKLRKDCGVAASLENPKF